MRFVPSGGRGRAIARLTDAARRYREALELTERKLRNQALTFLIGSFARVQEEAPAGSIVSALARLLEQLACYHSGRPVDHQKLKSTSGPSAFCRAVAELIALATSAPPPENVTGLGLGDVSPSELDDALIRDRYDVIVVPNLYGDIISDLASGLVGGLGMAPSGHLGHHTAIFEAVHGGVPKYKGRNKANPTALILSAVLLLHHLDMHDQAERLEKAVAAVIDEGKQVTFDLVASPDDNPATGTQEMAEAIIDKLTETS